MKAKSLSQPASLSLSPAATLSSSQVLDTCQKQEGVASRGGGVARCAAMLPFSCSTSDVLSCIMHVISQGYLRRHDDSPHIVEYLAEDPATPKKGHAQFSFARAGAGASGQHGNGLRCEPAL